MPSEGRPSRGYPGEPRPEKRHQCRIDREEIALVVVVESPPVDSSHGHGDVGGRQDHERRTQPPPATARSRIPPQGVGAGRRRTESRGPPPARPLPTWHADRPAHRPGWATRPGGTRRGARARLRAEASRQPVGSRCRGAVRTASAGGSRGRTPESSGARPSRADASRRERREGLPRGKRRGRGSSSRSRVRAPGPGARRERRRGAMARMRPGARGGGRACRGRARGGSGCGPGASNRGESLEVSPGGSPSTPPRGARPCPTPDARPDPSKLWTAAPVTASGWRTRCPSARYTGAAR